MAEIVRRPVLAMALGVVAASRPAAAQPAPPSAFDFTLEAIEGGPLPLAPFRGRALLVVNTASFCGFTPQYAALQRLHDRHEARGFTVVGVPSNDFNQEHADNRAVRAFCEATFGITFPLAAITRVRGDAAHPLFHFLAARGGGAPRWNFHKYLVGRDGRSVRAFPSTMAPDAPVLARAGEAALEGRPLV